jgi:DHA3 family tetracycline resistance protein-like MFS transporter
VPPELLARVISLDWMCSFALMPLGLATVGPAVDALGRDAVLWVAVAFSVVPPLLCLAVPGMRAFRTPAAARVPVPV